MNICVIAPDYPDSKREVYPFVKALVDEWGKIGHHVVVIAPFSISRNKSITSYEELPHPNNIDILRPRVFTFSNIVVFGIRLSEVILTLSVTKVLSSLSVKPDLLYCHFWSGVPLVYKYALSNTIPVVVASGESVIPEYISTEPYKTMCNYVSKVVCVSTKNKRDSVRLGLTLESKCRVFPNAIDDTLFCVSNQNELKSCLGIKETDFVLAFVGWFVNRKGALRVSEAIDKLDDDRVKIMFIGKGPENPDCKGILYKGVLPHEEIPKYLNCADAFVLPTLAEGCCNAVIEAMACGLPVISSNREFNLDVLNEKNSILIDPENISELIDAIAELRDNIKKRAMMSEAALKTALNLKINVRARNISDYLLENIDKYNSSTKGWN